MSKIKLCGLKRIEDIAAANALQPEYIGFVFAPKSARAVTGGQAAELKARLHPSIRAVGVFVDAPLTEVVGLLKQGVIDLAQLHGTEGEDYICAVKAQTGREVIRAFRVKNGKDLEEAEESPADHILLDSGAGTGQLFDWNLLRLIRRPYFLAGGLDADNVEAAVRTLRPYAVDVSSGIETDGIKDAQKMQLFVQRARAAAGRIIL